MFKKPRTLNDYHFTPFTIYSCSVALWTTVIASIFFAAYFADLYFGKDAACSCACDELDKNHRPHMYFFSFEQLRGFLAFLPAYILCIVMTVHNSMIQWEYRKNVKRITNPLDGEQPLMGKEAENKGWFKWQHDNTWIYYQAIWWIVPLTLASCKISFDRRATVSWFWVAATCFMPWYYIAVGIKERTYLYTDTRETNQQTFETIRQVEMQNLQASNNDGSASVDVDLTVAELSSSGGNKYITLPNGSKKLIKH